MKLLPLLTVLLGTMTTSTTLWGSNLDDPLNASRLGALYHEHGREASVWLRFSFSRSQDLALTFQRTSAENSVINTYETRLIPRSARLDEKTLQEGELVHSNGDDATPWHINGTYIGGNHGCASVLELSIPEGSLTEADIGSAWKDETGATFYVIDVPAPGMARMLSENLATYPFWKFHDRITGSTLTRATDGATLAFTQSRLTQLWPSARIKDQKFLADGKTPLSPGKLTECSFVDIVEDYDIINPAAVLAELIKHPGQRPDFVGPDLDGVINNKITYRISPNASVVISHHATALQPFHLRFMGFIQQSLLAKPVGSSDVIRYYIPKAEKFEQDGATYDFRQIQPFDEPPKSPLHFIGNDGTNTRDLPDRFIQFLGRPDSEKNKNRLGLALGYSLTSGLTSQDNPQWQRKNAGFIHTSCKTYPFALDETIPNPVPAGTVFDCVAYRQYFNPGLQTAATSVFWHSENGKTTLFIGYHQPVKSDRIRLPRSFAGRSFRTLEKTESLSISPGSVIPAQGLTVSCNSNHGYAVIAIDETKP